MTMLRNLILPRGCAGCDAPDEVLCDACLRAFADETHRPMPGTIRGESYACASYRGVTRRAILAWKDHGDEECDEIFARLLSGLAIRTGFLDTVMTTLLVPAPSSRRSMRQRGRWHMRSLTVRVCRILSRQGYSVAVAPVLRTVHHVRSKSVEAGGIAQRNSRIVGNIMAVDGASCRGRSVIVLDDIVTTGATMRQCIGVLRQCGAQVVTTLSLASVERRSVD